MLFFVVFLCMFNIVSWIFFLRKFKSLFTTDDVISAAKSEINKIVADLNNNASRDITIIEDKIATLNSIIKEADKRIKILMDFEKQSAGLVRLSEKVSPARKSHAVKRAANAYGKQSASSYPKGAKYNRDDVDLRSLEITPSGREELTAQTTLFDSVDDVPGAMGLEEAGASYAKVPVVNAASFYPESPVSDGMAGGSNGSFKHRIVSLFNAGLTVEQIAKELLCSTTEVQFALSLENLI